MQTVPEKIYANGSGEQLLINGQTYGGYFIGPSRRGSNIDHDLIFWYRCGVAGMLFLIFWLFVLVILRIKANKML